MKIKLTVLIAMMFCIVWTDAQNSENGAGLSDSAAVVQALKALSNACANVDFTDPKVLDLGTFYKAAPYVVYRGDDADRKWKSPCNYENESERRQVDGVCLDLNRTINRGSTFEIEKYWREKESEGVWNLLSVNWQVEGKMRSALCAFLKVDGQFLLGDID